MLAMVGVGRGKGAPSAGTAADAPVLVRVQCVPWRGLWRE
jgi:hypothetical protein